MILVSFIDELVKVGAIESVKKCAFESVMDQSATSDIPQGLVGDDPLPDAIRLHPAEAATRLPQTAHLKSTMQPGDLGGITEAKDPIDKHKHNRAYRDQYQ